MDPQNRRAISPPQIRSQTLKSSFIRNIRDPHRHFAEISPPLQHILSQCNGFETLKSVVGQARSTLHWKKRLHWSPMILRDYHRKHGQVELSPGCLKKMLLDLCEELIESGFLMELEDFKKRFAEPQKKREITSLVVPTGNRHESMLRALKSYSHHLESHSRPTRILVSDDSSVASDQEKNRAAVALLQKNSSHTFCFIGDPERQNFIEALVKKGLHRSTLEFALQKVDPRIPSYGKNRNCLQLACIDEIYFSADDDTLCRIHQSSEAREDIKFLPGEQAPQEIQQFSSRDQALASHPLCKKSLFELHEKLVGKTLGHLVAEASLENGENLPLLDGEHKQHVFDERSRVRLCFSGLLGDSASDNQLGHFFGGQEEIKKYLGSEEQYQKFSAHRDILKSSSCYRVVKTKRCMTTFYSCDSLGGLPPFAPHLRMGDSIFARLMYHISPMGYAGFVPAELEHLPLVERKRIKVESSLKTHAEHSFVTFHELVCCSLSGLPVFFRVDDEIGNLKKLAAHMLDFCELPFEDYADRAILKFAETQSQYLLQLESILENNKKFPKFWRNDVENSIRSIQQQLKNRIVLAEANITTMMGVDEGEKWTHKYLQRYARLCYEWPDILEATRELKKEGIVLGRRLDA